MKRLPNCGGGVWIERALGGSHPKMSPEAFPVFQTLQARLGFRASLGFRVSKYVGGTPTQRPKRPRKPRNLHPETCTQNQSLGMFPLILTVLYRYSSSPYYHPCTGLLVQGGASQPEPSETTPTLSILKPFWGLKAKLP